MKANPVAWLREYLSVDRDVATATNLNDLPMFGVADAAYAVANAAADVPPISL